VIAGALGICGRALLERLEGRPEWDIVGLSRRRPDFETRAAFVSVDLLDRADTQAKLAGLGGATHVFYSALTSAGSPAADVAPNLAMLVNLVEALEPAAKGLKHVQLIHGSKWYGNHLGPYRTPSRESDPPHMPPNFYFDQQRWIAERQKGKAWTWSTLRPHGPWGFAIGSPLHQLNALAVYATVSRELGLPLRFPGTPACFNAVYQMTDAGLLAEAMEWVATTPAAANEPFNVNNGEFTRWCNLWPLIARQFGMETGPVQTIRLVDFMADKEPLWAKIVQKHQLKPYRIADLTQWTFADWVYGTGYDQMSSTTKLRQAGFHSLCDTEDMVVRQIARLKRERIVP